MKTSVKFSGLPALLLLLLMPFYGVSQPNKELILLDNPYAALKEGALLVRLKNKEKQVDALNRSGHPDKAAKLKSEQENENLNLIAAFRKKYTFSPVYFFYPDQSEAVLDKKFDQVVFLDDNLQPDPGIKFTKETFFTAEISVVDQEEVKRSKAEEERGEKFHEGSVSTFQVLMLKDNYMEQLPGEKILYVRTWDSLFLRRKAENIVRIFNSKITSRYKNIELFNERRIAAHDKKYGK